MDDILTWSIGRSERPVHGILHVGANSGQEADRYAELGLNVIWIEADPHQFDRLRENLVSLEGQTAYLCLASDVDGQEVDFHIASNAGGSSSVLAFDTNKFAKEWPGIKEIKTVRLKTCRLDTLFARHGCDLSGINLIVADVQGYELPVLRGLGNRINGFDVIIAELNWKPIYKGATKPYELESFLVKHGFKRLWLGIGDVQAAGVWDRGCLGPLQRFYLSLTVHLYYVVSRCGVVSLLRTSGLLGLGRRVYCAVKRRAG